MNALQRIFLSGGSTLKNKEAVGGTLGKLKTVNEHLADLLEATEKLDVVEALRAASPWAEAIGSALGDAVPPVRFVIKLFEKLTEVNDPNQLGYLAATLAFQRSVEQAWEALAPETRDRIKGADPLLRKKALAELRSAVPAETYDFGKFNFDAVLASAFFIDAERFLKASLLGLGLTEADFLNFQHGIRIRFVSNLKGILSHGDTRNRFAPFRDQITLGTAESQAYDALREHADYQRWLFEEQRVLGREPFTLAQVYTETDCGVLLWKDVQKKSDSKDRGEPVDPFSEENGGRHSLLETVLSLIADKDFRDTIVIQGVAGSGKSSSTLRLAWELVRQGLRPIRVELKHLDSRESVAIEEALPEAVHLTSRERSPDAGDIVFGKDLFLDDTIFKESVVFRGTKICPYVLILDGWDEISIGASGGYQQRVGKMLEAVRHKFLSSRGFPIRVVLAGRPSQAIEASKFLHEDTRLLTVRDFSPAQLETYVAKVKAATDLGQDRIPSWSLAKVKVLPAVLGRYRRAHNSRSSDLEILGLPLLAHLALRLLAERPDDSESLLENTTSLYRSLVDLVVGQAGKPVEAKVEGSAFLKGDTLRELLRGTAEAMTSLGTESIPHGELMLRLGLEEETLQARVDALSGELVLSRLMISFFFRGGINELGAEFSHKSFREFLFAEQVVETLKVYGRKAPDFLPERRPEDYWKDFPVDDPRRELCHRLAKLLGPVWLAPEVNRHLQRLLDWEIVRTDGANENSSNSTTTMLTHREWERTRDALADAWDWWGEGVHLRPQPTKERKTGNWSYDPSDRPLALQVVEDKRLNSDLKQCPVPQRITGMDAHLGDGLCLLTGFLHARLVLRRAEDAKPLGDHGNSIRWRRYQAYAKYPKQAIVFSPSGLDREYFFNYCARINAAGYRPVGPFPMESFLGQSDLHQANFRGAYLGGANLGGANLSGADFTGADLRGTNLSRTNLNGAHLTWAYLRGANLQGAVLTGADLRGANLRGANLRGADLRGATLSGADLRETDLHGTYVRRSGISKAIYEADNLAEIFEDDVQDPDPEAS